ncbi:MAG TPA: heavy metal-associated domain-containing protein, partial [Gammaproteobacteria bacterium]|nr:heavy metal-associated domain-containing protein [Gammaproteobacteria bacterium]
GSTMKPISNSLLVAIALAFPGVVPAEGLVEVRQAIFGMDCAPCAFGVKKGLKALPGVEAVRVSLNDGYAEVSLASGSPISMVEIREVIRDNGFTPKKALIRLEGEFHRVPEPHLQAGEVVYALAFDGPGRDTASPEWESGQLVAVTGSIAADDSIVQVERIEPRHVRRAPAED